jgi:hypothetical protein
MTNLQSNRFQDLLKKVNNRLNKLERYASSGRWVSYTPTIGGTGWTLGADGSAYGKYVRHGNNVSFWAVYYFGSLATYGAGRPTIQFPLKATADVGFQTGAIQAYAATSTNTWLLFASQDTVNSMQLYAQRAVVPALGTVYLDVANVTSTIPFTWSTATTPRINISGTYEATEYV